MRHIMVCVSGWAKSGKDTACERLIRQHAAVQTGLADVGKRYIMEVYGFTYDQVFGPSEMRNAGDPRIPKNIYLDYHGEVDNFKTGQEEMHHIDLDEEDVRVNGLEKILSELTSIPFGAGFRRYYFKNTDPTFFLSPREVLQKHLEQFNEFHINTWARKGLDQHVQLSDVINENNGWSRKWDYDKEKGIIDASKWGPLSSDEIPFITCFSDFRHIHEYKLARTYNSENRTVVLVRIKRPGISKPPFNHRSETEQALVRDEAFDFVIDNDSTISALYERVDDIVKIVSDPSWKSKEWSDNLVVRSHDPSHGYIK